MSDNTSPTVFCVSSSLALFLHPDLGLIGFFTQSWDLLVSGFFDRFLISSLVWSVDRLALSSSNYEANATICERWFGR